MRKRIITTLGFAFFGLFILLNGLICQSLAGEIKIKIPISTVTVSEDNEGNAKYSGKNVQYLIQSGEPMIPYQVIKVLLPPDADLNTVSGTIDNIKVEELTGEWEVRPKPPEAIWDGKKVITIWPKGKTIVNGYDINVYEKNVLFPENLIGTITVGQTRRWRMVDIPIALYKFNPVAKKLLRLVEGELIVEFTIDPTVISGLKERTGIPDRIGEDSVKKLTVNFNEVSPVYEKIFPQSLTPQQIGGYAIITTNNVKFGSSELQNFVSSKEMRGFTVEVVTEDAWGGGTGDTAAENIRNWLSNNYENKNIEYVLLIGNPNPNSGDIPMKMLWPRSGSPEYRESPSDYYYADLTGNWDLDGDGLYGEEIDDFGTGGVDRNWDVLVGRIPYYGNMNDLDAILAKIIAYENETSNEAVWRQNVLLPMEPSDSNTPGYHLGEAIKDDTVVPKDNWNYHRVYDEDYGLIPPSETYPCDCDNVTNAWNSSQFGAIFWWTHGSSQSAAQIMDLSHAATLDDSYPGFTFQASCNNSYPEVTDNLSYSLLRNGCIGTIGATRVSWYYPGQTNFIGSTSNAGMTYEYAKRLIEKEMDSGHALYEMKQVLIPGIWMNFTVFNIYGDPSTGLFTAYPDPVGPAGYTYIADEDESFTFTETVDVAYGANGQFNYLYGVTGTITFDNATFGDPIFGVAKAGFYRNADPDPVGPDGYTYIADEDESVTFTETVDVAYGANGQFNYLYGVTGTITFDNATFGDPIFGVAKAGFYRSAAPVGPDGYTYVADEDESFTFTETVDVAYGANGQFNYMYGVTGTITFDNATFGDPIFGVAKAGFYRSAAPVGPDGYTYVADEDESFTFTETVDVAYGANGQFNYMYGVTGTITFDNATFGDPIFGVAKAGFYRNAAPVGPDTYTYIADEDESVTFTETVDVAYGANGQFNYMYGVTGTITFDNATFGDPIFGVAKAGFYRSAAPVGPDGYTYVADEDESFTFTETVDVAYGANGQFNYMYGVTGTITFDNATFGDPIFGVAKAGFYKSEN